MRTIKDKIAVPDFRVFGKSNKAAPQPVRNTGLPLTLSMNTASRKENDMHLNQSNKTILIGIILLFGSVTLTAQSRMEQSFEKGWKFSKTDEANAAHNNFDDASWQTVTIPHDWAIYGPFDENTEVRMAALPYTGTVWYRYHFDLPEFDKDKSAFIVFDGAMSHTQVWLNGAEVGYWPYGYNSFHFDITKHLKEKDNVLAVRLENFPYSSRWYTGAGIYRNVHLIVTGDVHIPVWGTFVTTPVVKNEYAKINIKSKVEGPGLIPEKLTLVTEIKDAAQKVISRVETGLTVFDDHTFEQVFTVVKPDLWSPDTPVMYTAVSKLYDGRELKDTYTTRFGIRSLKIIPEKGMFLNGKSIKFKGVCLHHDLGPLGAAVNKSAIRRQLALLKDMGCNAIRTAHNMPAPELVELCDEMGFMMMVEAFDEWQKAKVVDGYHLYFDEWAERDLVNMVRHYRNNPSIVLWSIGNEVMMEDTPEGVRIARYLRDICHREDPTRPVTGGMERVAGAIDKHFASTLDVPGLNYRLQFYHKTYLELAQEVVLGTETASAFSTRGTYHFPVAMAADKHHDDRQTTSYDVEYGSWANLADDDAVFQDDYPWVIGEFVWTGFDYLGEPSPYNEWPNHSSMFGIVDLAGIPKDRYYLYRSRWNPDEETLHILPHWTWPERIGQTTPVFVYTGYPSAELFVNGKSQGKVTKDESITVEKTIENDARKQFLRQKRYRLMWPEVKYEPGIIRVVAYDRSGKAVAEKYVRTAGKPHHIELQADRTSLSANGKDLAFITVRIVDKDGNLCPEANNRVQFKVAGSGSYRAAANGDPTCLEQFHLPAMSVFKGQLTAIVQSSERAGKIRFEAQSAGLKKMVLEFESNNK